MRSHKRNNHIYLVQNTLAKDEEVWFGLYVALRAEDAKRYALHRTWGDNLNQWSQELFKALEVRDMGMTKSLASNEPIGIWYKQKPVEGIYRSILDHVAKIEYIPANRIKKKDRQPEPLPGQVCFEDV